MNKGMDAAISYRKAFLQAWLNLEIYKAETRSRYASVERISVAGICHPARAFLKCNKKKLKHMHFNSPH